MSTIVQPATKHAIETTSNGHKVRYSYFEASEDVLRPLVEDILKNHWSRIVMGPSMPGAGFELQFEHEPRVEFSKGMFTIYPGKWHFHLCVGPGTGGQSEDADPKRAVARAAIYERRGKFRSFGLRFWNGYGEQMTSISLPNIRYSDDFSERLEQPDYRRLQLYFELRERLLGEPIPSDFETTANMAWPEDEIDARESQRADS